MILLINRHTKKLEGIYSTQKNVAESGKVKYNVLKNLNWDKNNIKLTPVYALYKTDYGDINANIILGEYKLIL